MDAKVLILMGSESDFKAMAECVKVLEEFGVSPRVHVASAHRTPAKVMDLVRQAEEGATQVIIAAAGMSAHLAGVVAAHTTLPVIGVPMDSPHMNGVDSLYSTVMMPPGIPVATVGIGSPGAKNAGYLAISLLGLSDAGMREKLRNYRAHVGDKVEKMDQSVQQKLAEMRS